MQGGAVCGARRGRNPEIAKEMKFLKAVWAFCSNLFVPQWERYREMEVRNNEFMEMKG